MALGSQKPRRIPRGLIPALLVILSLALLTVGAREGAEGPIRRLREATMVATAPLQQLGSVLAVPLRALNETGENATASQERVTELLARNEELTALVGRLEEYRLENERLKALLELVDAYRLEASTSRILSHSNDSWNQIITIDKGANDGIGAGMPVMSANGLLGQVETTGPFTSTVRLITDPSSGVSVFLQASRKEGILTGSPERLLYLSYMSVDSQVEPGDVVITSGAGGIYPKGIVIGEVVSATHSVTDVYQTVVVKPVSRVESYEEVVVLTGRATEVATPTFGGSSSGGSSTSGNASGDSTSGSSAAGATGDITSDTAGTGTTAEVGATGDTGTGTLASTGGGG